DGRAQLRLFAFDVEDLRMDGVPVVRASYAELLWRIAVVHAGHPAWWVLACDLGPAIPRIAAGRLVRYPVRPNHVELVRDRLRVTSTAGELELAIGSPTDETAPVEARRVLVGDGGDASTVAISIVHDQLATATIGAPVTWSTTGWQRTGREHRCGIAHPIS